jgi:hypothetical protein
MTRSFHRAAGKQRLAAFPAFGILLFALYPSALIAQKTVQSRRPETKEEITRATLKITNKCQQPHYFRVTSDVKDPRFRQQADAILIGTNATDKIEILFDAMGLKINPKATVKCLDCKKEEGCSQDSYEVPLEVSAPDAAAFQGGTHVSTRWASGRSVQSGGNDVGIIPEVSGQCPIGSEFEIISTDDEDTHNSSSVSGWAGDISHYSTGTTFGFCRVDGNQFHSLPSRDYAVLQLDATCPTGAKSMLRVFDDEHNHNNNWSSGNISPSSQSVTNQTCMVFCFFPAGVTPTMSSFPNLHVAYGVFAAPPSLMGQPTGFLHVDDNDGSNADRTCASSSCSSGSCPTSVSYANDFAKIIHGSDQNTPFGGRDTDLFVTKVANPGPCTTPCPYTGSYDGANCWLGQPPPGTTAFIWANNFYYSPVSGAQTSAQKCPKPGSWYDGANCFVQAIPSQTHPFIWANMWYVDPVCRP